MKLCQKDNITDYVYSKDLSLSAIGLLNSLLCRSNDELEDINLYSISNNSPVNVIKAFRELKNNKYVIYNSDNEVYEFYAKPQNNLE